MGELLAEPWPWYVTGPLIGLTVPLLLWAGGEFGVSENLRHICSAVLPTKNDFFHYDWKSKGLWNLTFALGIVLGAALAAALLPSPNPVIAISDGSSPRQRAEFRRQLPEFASVMGWIGRSASVYRLLVRQRNPQRIEDFCLAGVGNRQPCDAGLLIHSIFQ